MTMDMDVARLGQFSPFNALKTDNLLKLLEQVETAQAKQGEALFKERDANKRAIYLLSGTVELIGSDGVKRVIVGGTNKASGALSPSLPRKHTAIALDAVQYFSIDSELLDVTLTLDQTGIYEVGEFTSGPDFDADDWMAALLQTKIFQQVPPQSIQMIFMRLERMNYKAGDVVIRQGDEGDYFYFIRSGRCMVTRETPANKNNIDLAELGEGGTFGEEALISLTERTATVRMMTDGILMRLGRDDFHALLNKPLLTMLEKDEADEAAAHGGKWLDVRLPSEFKSNGKSDAVNLPLYVLRHKLNVLDIETPYIVYCDTGRRSSAAAFILSQHGFQSAVLKDGLNGG